MEKKLDHQQFPPVISVLGHVDHGKTTLLDTIRKTNITDKEHGGITQSIGESSVEIEHDGKKRSITFIDTPGHEAFSKMRSHGVASSDIVFLVVAADDGIKPQTKESIGLILEAKIPYIVVITKIDLETAQVTKVKKELVAQEVMLEGMGGEVPFIGVSSKKGEKIKDLLELALVVYDLASISKDKNGKFLGNVIESRIDKRRGALASVIVKNGALSVGDNLYTTTKRVGKVKALIDTFGKNVPEVLPGDAAEILGVGEVLSSGELLFKEEQEKVKTQEKLVTSREPMDLATLMQEKVKSKLPIVVKTHTSGEYEAILSSLPESVEVVFEGRGDIAASDVLLAKDFKAIIVGFNVGIEKQAKSLADNQNTFYRTYTIIYELLDELKDAAGLLHEGPKVRGKAEILAQFDGNEGKIIGASVIEGRIALNDMVVLENDKEEKKAKIISLKQGKKDVKEAGKGKECGFMISPSIDFTIGDVVLSYGPKN